MKFKEQARNRHTAQEKDSKAEQRQVKTTQAKLLHVEGKLVQRRLRSPGVSQVYQSTFSSKARGIAILIRKTIPFVFNSITADPGGRYVLVTGAINSFPLVLLNIYAPYFICPDFFCKDFNLVSEYNTHNIIIGGDFICYFNPQFDRSFTNAAPPLKPVPVLNDLVNSFDLVDIWRLLHPFERQYSFFSPAYGTFTRTDHFLVDSKLTSHTQFNI